MSTTPALCPMPASRAPPPPPPPPRSPFTIPLDSVPLRWRRVVGELAQVPPGRLVGAVLAPHHRVERQFRIGRPAPEQVPDPLVLLGCQPEFPVRLGAVRGGSGQRHAHVPGLPRG